MRLALRALSLALAATLGGQEPGLPPGEAFTAVPWQPLTVWKEPSAPESAAPGTAVFLDLSPDGSLRILRGRGVVALRAGLPGRPVRAWRDGGIPLDPPYGRWGFAPGSPLQAGIGSLPWGRGDFRNSLRGLVWVLDDSERVITVLHPATARRVAIPLPASSGAPRLIFHPDRLEVREDSPVLIQRREARGWSIPWLALLPHFALLGQPAPDSRQGTALNPYPGE